MIRGLHGLFYSSDPDATRAFLRDTMKLPYTDVGEGWLIFDLPEGDLGIHPVDESGRPPPGEHDVSFYCDDIHGTVQAMQARGAVFQHDVQDHGYGLVTYVLIPGGIVAQLYEPRYTKRRAAPPRAAARKPATRKRAARKPAATGGAVARKKQGAAAKRKSAPAAGARKGGGSRRSASAAAGRKSAPAARKQGAPSSTRGGPRGRR